MGGAYWHLRKALYVICGQTIRKSRFHAALFL
jgi:hypothetical protein